MGIGQSGFSQWLVLGMAGVPGGTAGFLAITIVAFIILGSVLEGLPAIVLFGPLLFPVAKAMGVHEVRYVMIVILAMGIGLFAPPFGVGCYSTCSIGRVLPDDGLWRIWLYIGAPSSPSLSWRRSHGSRSVSVIRART
jgi:TRAP-type C4-dicarboxylate transport system permease large subunit